MERAAVNGMPIILQQGRNIKMPKFISGIYTKGLGWDAVTGYSSGSKDCGVRISSVSLQVFEYVV